MAAAAIEAIQHLIARFGQQNSHDSSNIAAATATAATSAAMTMPDTK